LTKLELPQSEQLSHGTGKVEAGRQERLKQEDKNTDRLRPDKPSSALGPVVGRHSIKHIVQTAIEDSQALAVEKFGAAPSATLLNGSNDIDNDFECVCVDAQVHYILLELLKNSYRAMIGRYGVLDIQDVKGVEVSISSSQDEVGVVVSDHGGGMNVVRQSASLQFFYSTAPPLIATYTYSRQFGTAFDGLGFGLPMSKLYAELMGGTITVGVKPGLGCSVYVVLNRSDDKEHM